MSDEQRKDFSTKAKEAITPDSSKSDWDKAKEQITDTTDRFKADFMQSDSSKGTAQAAFDKGKREKDGTFLDKAKVRISREFADHRKRLA
jgi:Heat shock protein 9/12